MAWSLRSSQAHAFAMFYLVEPLDLCCEFVCLSVCLFVCVFVASTLGRTATRVAAWCKEVRKVDQGGEVSHEPTNELLWIIICKPACTKDFVMPMGPHV